MAQIAQLTGVLAALVNALAALVGAWRWWQVETSRAFWVLVPRGAGRRDRAGARRGCLGARRASCLQTGSIWLYALLPVAVSFVAEQFRIAAAQTVLDARGLEDAQAVGRLDEARAALGGHGHRPARDGHNGRRRAGGRLPVPARGRHRMSHRSIPRALPPQAVGRFATGVAVVTCQSPSGPAGLTTNAITSLSLDPLLLLVCFDNASRTLPVLRESGRFAVNVLARRAGRPRRRVRLQARGRGEVRDGHPRGRPRRARARRRAGVAGLRPARAAARRRPHDRHRRGHPPRRSARASRSCSYGGSYGRLQEAPRPRRT